MDRAARLFLLFIKYLVMFTLFILALAVVAFTNLLFSR